MRSNNRSIMDEFRKARPDYEVLQEIVVPMLEKGIKKSGLGVQGIESRIKRRSSLEEKLNRKRDKYDALEDITDILGLRVITFFTDDVDKVAKVVSEIFHVDKIHSVDQREVISPTNFGYLSLHYICSLPKDQEFPENRPGSVLKCRCVLLCGIPGQKSNTTWVIRMTLVFPRELRESSPR